MHGGHDVIFRCEQREWVEQISLSRKKPNPQKIRKLTPSLPSKYYFLFLVVSRGVLIDCCYCEPESKVEKVNSNISVVVWHQEKRKNQRVNVHISVPVLDFGAGLLLSHDK